MSALDQPAASQPLGASLGWVRRHPVWSFTLLAFGLSWALFALPALLFPRASWPLISALLRIGTFGPAVAGLALAAILNPAPTGHRRAARWGLFAAAAAFSLGFRWLSRGLWLQPGNTLAQYALLAIAMLLWAAIIAGVLGRTRGVRAVMRGLAEWPGWDWMLLVALAPLVVECAGIWLTLTLGGQVRPFLRPEPWAAQLPIVLFVLIQTLIDGGGNEEPGWRGFMLAQLQQRYSPLVAGLAVGVAMGLWPLPLHFVGAYAGSSVFADNALGLAYRVVSSTVLSLGLTYLYNRPRGGLLLATWFHVVVNTSAGFIASTPITQALMIALMLALIPIGKMWRRLPPRVAAAQRGGGA